MKKAEYIKNLIAERGEAYYNKNKALLDAQFEYIQSLGDIKDIKKETDPNSVVISTNNNS